MSEPAVYTIHIDGAARGNPGPAAYAFLIERKGAAPVEEKGCLGQATNNVAEYTALVRALERAAELGPAPLIIHSDSELLVKQMNGEYQVKKEELRALYIQAKRLCQRFPAVEIRHVPRSANSQADRLCNEALDGQQRKAVVPQAKKSPRASRSRGTKQEAAQEEAVTCLRAAATAWARGDPNNPLPEQVWDQLWSILEENALLRHPSSAGLENRE
jgi:ribonuclease HI